MYPFLAPPVVYFPSPRGRDVLFSGLPFTAVVVVSTAVFVFCEDDWVDWLPVVCCSVTTFCDCFVLVFPAKKRSDEMIMKTIIPSTPHKATGLLRNGLRGEGGVIGVTDVPCAVDFTGVWTGGRGAEVSSMSSLWKSSLSVSITATGKTICRKVVSASRSLGQ